VDFSQQLAQSALACFGEHAFLFALCYGWRDFVDKNEIGSDRVFEDLNLPNCESNLCGDFVKFIKSLNLAPAVGFEPTTNRLTADRSTTELRWNFSLPVAECESCLRDMRRQVRIG
jgi:hypothetical protein